MDPQRRRFLRLAGLGAFSVVGAGTLATRLLESTPDEPGTSPTISGPTSSPTASTEPATETTDTTETTETNETPPPNAAAVAMLCRDAWGAEAPTRRMASHEIRGIMVHHTAVLLTDNRDAPQRLRSHQSFHQSRGFADLAYHVVIDGDGHVYEGRDPAVPGETFTEYDPRGWYLVACEGNFDAQPLPSTQRRSLERVLAWASAEFGVEPGEVLGHSAVSPTGCPGDALEAVLADGSLTAAMHTLSGGVTVTRSCGPEAAARVDAIEAGTA